MDNIGGSHGGSAEDFHMQALAATMTEHALLCACGISLVPEICELNAFQGRNRAGQGSQSSACHSIQIQCLAPLLKNRRLPLEHHLFVLSTPSLPPIVPSSPSLLLATPEVKLDPSLPPGMPPFTIITCQCYCTFPHRRRPAFNASREA